MSGSSPWNRADTVAGFARSLPNARLLEFAEARERASGFGRVLDIGCGAARNAVPLAARGWRVLGTDLSRPMLLAAAARANGEGLGERVQLVEAEMAALPVLDATFDLVIAHGIWNLAQSGHEFRRGLAEAARAATRRGALSVHVLTPHDSRDCETRPRGGVRVHGILR